MNRNPNRIPPRPETTAKRDPLSPAALVALCAAAFLAAALSSCSSVFSSSIQGRLIDAEAYDESQSRVVGISDARVFLYVEEADRDADYAAYRFGDKDTVPDKLHSTRYFASTSSGTDGSFSFSGVIWHTLFPKYGKTADRRELFLLAYHPDYGLNRNPNPIYVLSDVTSRIADMRLYDLYHSGRMSGKVLNWKDGKGLGNVQVRMYAATSWDYDAGGNFIAVRYPDTPSATATTGTDGLWSGTLRFPVMPNRQADRKKAPVRLVFYREQYRANDPGSLTDLDTLNSVGASGGILIDWDIDNDGRLPDSADPDYEEAYIQATVVDTSEQAVTELSFTPILQRWRFNASVSGRVFLAGPAPKEYLNGVEVALELNGQEPRTG